jgi:hypothetical protein
MLLVKPVIMQETRLSSALLEPDGCSYASSMQQITFEGTCQSSDIITQRMDL